MLGKPACMRKCGVYATIVLGFGPTSMFLGVRLGLRGIIRYRPLTLCIYWSVKALSISNKITRFYVELK